MFIGGISLVKTVQILELVNNKYSIAAVSAEKIKNVYKLKGYNGDYCLKVVHYEMGHFLFILEAIKHLNKRGFENVPEIIKTTNGKDYIEFENCYAYLTKWFDARQCNYDNPFDVILAASTLAKLHKKSENFEVKDYMSPRIYWLRWIEIFNARKNEILDFQNRILKKENRTEFDNKYLSMISDEVSIAEKAVTHLASTSYYSKMLFEFCRKGFCHHDFAHHNVLIGKDNEINVIDFDYCILDTHLHDLGSLLIRKMKNGKWDINNALFILDVYNQIYPLQIDEIPIMAAFIEFPQDFWQAGIQYYWEQQPWEEQFFINKLNKIAFDGEEKQEFISKFRNLKYRG